MDIGWSWNERQLLMSQAVQLFDEMMRKYTLKSDKKRHYHRDSTMSKAEIMLIMILIE